MIQQELPFTQVKRLSDVQKAKNWLKNWAERWFTVEEIKSQANLNIGVPALARKMRLARQNGGIESRIRENKIYMEYRHKGEKK